MQHLRCAAALEPDPPPTSTAHRPRVTCACHAPPVPPRHPARSPPLCWHPRAAVRLRHRLRVRRPPRPCSACALSEVRPRRPASPTPRARRLRCTAVSPSSCPLPAFGCLCSLHLRRAARVCSGQTAETAASGQTCESRAAAAPSQQRQPTGASPTLHARSRLARFRGGVVVRVARLSGGSALSLAEWSPCTHSSRCSVRSFESNTVR